MEMLHTELGKTYWNKDAVYYKQYSHLYDNHVPAKGSCKTLHGELVRAISRLQYEYFNNGNCNACVTTIETETCGLCSGSGSVYDGEDEDCDYCDGNGSIDEDGESYVSDMYGQFLELIEKTVPESKVLCDEIIEVICDDINPMFSDEQEYKYTKLMDLVIYYVLSTTDSEIPEWYNKF